MALFSQSGPGRRTDGRTQLSLCGCCCKPTDRLRRWDALGVLRSPHPSLARRERSLCLGKRRLNVRSACCGRRYGSLARSPWQLAPLDISESSFSDQKPDGKKWRPPARRGEAPRVAESVAPRECLPHPIGRPRNPGGQCGFPKNTQNCGEGMEDKREGG